jgi:hypothetical protein
MDNCCLVSIRPATLRLAILVSGWGDMVPCCDEQMGFWYTRSDTLHHAIHFVSYWRCIIDNHPHAFDKLHALHKSSRVFLRMSRRPYHTTTSLLQQAAKRQRNSGDDDYDEDYFDDVGEFATDYHAPVMLKECIDALLSCPEQIPESLSTGRWEVVATPRLCCNN